MSVYFPIVDDMDVEAKGKEQVYDEDVGEDDYKKSDKGMNEEGGFIVAECGWDDAEVEKEGPSYGESYLMDVGVVLGG